MLRLMMASHRNIGIPPEGGFIVTLGWIWGWSKLTSSDYFDLIEAFFEEDNAKDWEISIEQLTEAVEKRAPRDFPEFVDEVYRTYLRHKFPGKSIWGDKTAWYADFIPMIGEFFPGARFIHIIRDGRDIACSFRKMERASHDVRRIALEWTTNIDTIRTSAMLLCPRRFLEVYYEELVAQPEEILGNICRFLDVPYDDEMLSFHEKNKEQRLEPQRHMAWKQLTESPVTTSSTMRWRSELSEADIRLFESVAGGNLARLGYELSQSKRNRLKSIVGDLSAEAFGRYWRGRQRLRKYKARARRVAREIASSAGGRSA